MHDTTSDPVTTPDPYRYDVCLSFAGQQRDYVKRVADRLRADGIEVFYDDYEQVDLLGKDLTEYLHQVYSKDSRLCAMFISKDYAEKVWTIYERRCALERALLEEHEYLLPIRFDDTELPGIRGNVGYINAKAFTAKQLAAVIAHKVRKLPTPAPTADRLGTRRLLTFAAASAGAGALTGAATYLARLQHAYRLLTDSAAASIAASVLVVALIAAGAAWLVLGRGDADRRPRTAPWWTGGALAVGIAAAFPLGLGVTTYTETGANHSGSPLYRGPGTSVVTDRKVPFGANVEVDCKVPDSTGMPSVTAWYHIVGGQYDGLYSPSDTYRNGDGPEGGETAVDARVPDCSTR